MPKKPFVTSTVWNCKEDKYVSIDLVPVAVVLVVEVGVDMVDEVGVDPVVLVTPFNVVNVNAVTLGK